MQPSDPVSSIELFLFTADGCEMLTVYPVNDDGTLGAPIEGEWSDEPAEHTDGGSVAVVTRSGVRREFEITGDQHRDLENEGSYDTLFAHLANGANFSSALTASLLPAPPAPRRGATP